MGYAYLDQHTLLETTVGPYQELCPIVNWSSNPHLVWCWFPGGYIDGFKRSMVVKHCQYWPMRKFLGKTQTQLNQSTKYFCCFTLPVHENKHSKGDECTAKCSCHKINMASWQSQLDDSIVIRPCWSAYTSRPTKCFCCEPWVVHHILLWPTMLRCSSHNERPLLGLAITEWYLLLGAKEMEVAPFTIRVNNSHGNWE